MNDNELKIGLRVALLDVNDETNNALLDANNLTRYVGDVGEIVELNDITSTYPNETIEIGILFDDDKRVSYWRSNEICDVVTRRVTLDDVRDQTIASLRYERENCDDSQSFDYANDCVWTINAYIELDRQRDANVKIAINELESDAITYANDFYATSLYVDRDDLRSLTLDYANDQTTPTYLLLDDASKRRCRSFDVPNRESFDNQRRTIAIASLDRIASIVRNVLANDTIDVDNAIDEIDSIVN